MFLIVRQPSTFLNKIKIYKIEGIILSKTGFGDINSFIFLFVILLIWQLHKWAISKEISMSSKMQTQLLNCRLWKKTNDKKKL